MRPPRAAFVALFGAALAVVVALGPVAAQLSGHGGPVRALAISADGRNAISGGFDQSAILWDIEAGAARAVFRFHDGAVNAVLALPDGGFVTAGEDGRIAVYRAAGREPVRVLVAHKGPIVSLALSPDGARLASASWDGTVGVWSLPGGKGRLLDGHRGNVNAVAFLADARLASGGYDGAVRIWSEGAGAPVVATLPAPVNALAALPESEIAAAGADGAVRFVGSDGNEMGAIEASQVPITALALSPDGMRLAAATIAGEIVLIDGQHRRAVGRIAGAGGPVWALAFRPGGKELLSGGGDRLIRRWNLATGEPVEPIGAADSQADPPASEGDRGAELFQACAACHSLVADGGNRAGPSLHGVFGRHIATAPGYNFSAPLKQLDIVWNAETIGRLFEIGPSRYTPGTKMPEQIIADPADRAALVRFLERATTR